MAWCHHCHATISSPTSIHHLHFATSSTSLISPTFPNFLTFSPSLPPQLPHLPTSQGGNCGKYGVASDKCKCSWYKCRFWPHRPSHTCGCPWGFCKEDRPAECKAEAPNPNDLIPTSAPRPRPTHGHHHHGLFMSRVLYIEGNHTWKYTNIYENLRLYKFMSCFLHVQYIHHTVATVA